MQAESKNYLIPSDFGTRDPVNAKYAFCYQTEIVDKLERKKTKLNVILVGDVAGIVLFQQMSPLRAFSVAARKSLHLPLICACLWVQSSEWHATSAWQRLMASINRAMGSTRQLSSVISRPASQF